MTCIDVTMPPTPTKIDKLWLVVAGVVWDQDGRVLLTQRPEGKAYAGRWEFPGGKIEEGETPEVALVRELEEELGIVTNPGCLYPLTFVSQHYPEFYVLLIVYSIRQWSGTVTGREGQQFTWVRPNAMGGYDLLPTAVKTLPAILDLAN